MITEASSLIRNLSLEMAEVLTTLPEEQYFAGVPAVSKDVKVVQEEVKVYECSFLSVTLLETAIGYYSHMHSFYELVL